MKKSEVICLRKWPVYICPRIIWQQLFDKYRQNGGDLSNMDNMLIDYTNIVDLYNIGPNSFVWGFNEHRTVLLRKSELNCPIEQFVTTTVCDFLFLVEFDSFKVEITQLKGDQHACL